jgi:hypothetical protein
MSLHRPRFEVADVVCAHGEDYRRGHRPSAAQDKVLRHIASCRTAALGGHVDECTSCGHDRISYNSCRDRHCPKCQGPQRAQWITERLQRLLSTQYFHVVFTLPDLLNPLALRNKRPLFNILFRAASRTLLELAADPQHLGAQIGVTAVLHTWGQNMLFHPHLHCVVTGGGLSVDATRWVPGREEYLLPVKVLGKLFRGKFMAALQDAYNSGDLDLAGSTAELSDPVAWAGLRDRLYRKDWVVYAKPPFGGPEQVFKYLGRYTHRVAISNYRIVDFKDGRVVFSYRDYKDHDKKKLMNLGAVEFLRRFLLHVLPRGFVRIRHYGLHAGRNVRTRLATALRLLDPDGDTADSSEVSAPDVQPWWERFFEQTGIDVMVCPRCGGRLIRLGMTQTRLGSPTALAARAPPVAS